MPTSDATWRPKIKCAFPGPDSYALLFMLFIVVTIVDVAVCDVDVSFVNYIESIVCYRESSDNCPMNPMTGH